MQEPNQRYHATQKYSLHYVGSISWWSIRMHSLASSQKRSFINSSIIRYSKDNAASLQSWKRYKSSLDFLLLSSTSSANSWVSKSDQLARKSSLRKIRPNSYTLWRVGLQRCATSTRLLRDQQSALIRITTYPASGPTHSSAWESTILSVWNCLSRHKLRKRSYAQTIVYSWRLTRGYWPL